jgi:hypothetical protein
MVEALHSTDFTIRADTVVRVNPELARRLAGESKEILASLFKHTPFNVAHSVGLPPNLPSRKKHGIFGLQIWIIVHNSIIHAPGTNTFHAKVCSARKYKLT